MNWVIKTLGSMATGISAIVMGMFLVPLILIAVGIGVASLLADCLHPKRNLQNCSALVARSQSVPQS